MPSCRRSTRCWGRLDEPIASASLMSTTVRFAICPCRVSTQYVDRPTRSLSFAVGAAVVVVISLVASILIRRVTDTLGGVVEQVRSQQLRVMTMKDAVNAENVGVQGYLITSDPTFLDRSIADTTSLPPLPRSWAARTSAEVAPPRRSSRLRASFGGLRSRRSTSVRRGSPARPRCSGKPTASRHSRRCS